MEYWKKKCVWGSYSRATILQVNASRLRFVMHFEFGWVWSPFNWQHETELLQENDESQMKFWTYLSRQIIAPLGVERSIKFVFLKKRKKKNSNMFHKTCKIKDATGGAASFAAWWIDLWNISMSKALKNVWSTLRDAFSVSLLDVYMYCYGDHVTIILITTLFESKWI